MIPLYCFKLDKDTGIITRETIEEYHTVHPSMYIPSRVIYKYKNRQNGCDIHGENLDKFVNWKVYSFNSDTERAKKIILENLIMRHTKAQYDAMRFSDVIEKLGGIYGENKK